MFGMLKRSSGNAGGSIEYLVVGLGNPGNKYEMTRHNAGFLCMDELANRLNCKIDRVKFSALVCDTKIGDHRVLLMKPQTFMNLSGEAVAQAAKFYKIKPENILVVFDDISLDVGKLRIRRNGSHGGHNGIKSLIQCLGSDAFPRIKIGVGKKPHPDYDLADWVLSVFTKAEQEALFPAIGHAADAVTLLLDQKTDLAMNRYNS